MRQLYVVSGKNNSEINRHPDFKFAICDMSLKEQSRLLMQRNGVGQLRLGRRITHCYLTKALRNHKSDLQLGLKFRKYL